MKIAYLANSEIPSSTANSIHVMKMCQAFAKTGHEVKLFIPEHNNKISLEDVFACYGVESCFKIEYVSYKDIKGRAFWLGLSMANRVQQYNPDFVLGRILTGCFFTARKRYAVFYEAHQPVCDSGKLYDWLFNYAVKKKYFKKLVVITNALKKHFTAKNKIDERRIVVAPDGADPLDEQKIKKLNLGHSAFKIGYVGHMYPGKGMEIIAKLIKKCPEYEFHIVGGKGEELKYWKSQLEESENAFFYGFVPHEQTANYMKAVDILVAPYLREIHSSGGGEANLAQWTSPLKLFEYMSAKKAIVASNLPVLKEILVHNQNALLCAPDDIKEWEETLKLLKKDTELRKKIAEKAYRYFIDRYTWKSRTQNILAELQ